MGRHKTFPKGSFNLYTTAEVTLVSAVPEPPTLMLLVIGAVLVLAGIVRFEKRSAMIP